MSTVNAPGAIACYDIFDAGQISSIYQKIKAGQEHWTHRGAGFYTLGVASYLDCTNTIAAAQSPYWTRYKESNTYLRSLFGQELDLLRSHFETVYQCKVSFCDRLALPGFHIFFAEGLCSSNCWSHHFDVQYENHRSLFASGIDHLISFTVPIHIPASGAGLEYWDTDFNDFKTLGISASQMAIMRKSKRLEYVAGRLVVQNGVFLHRIAPSAQICIDDQRITLQGHGVISNNILYLYW